MTTSITAHCFPNPRTNLGLYSGSSQDSDAMLVTGHWIPKTMPLHAVYPRPDTETQAHARHRNYHSGFRYEIPVGVQGGARPLSYKLLVSPTGATIGEQFDDNNYGVISWVPSGQSGAQRFTIQVVDQDGDKTTLTWTAILNDAGFVFIKSGVASSGTGTLSSPLKTFEDWYKHDVNDATFLNKIAVFIGGTYNVIGDVSDGNVKFNLSAKTNSIIGDPDSRPTFDCTTAKFYSSIKLDGLYVSHIIFTNGRNDVTNPHFWWVASNPDGVTFFRNDFSNISHGTSGNDNTGPILLSGGDGNNVLIKGNAYHDFSNNGGGNGTYCTIFTFQYVLIEDELAYNTTTGTGWNAKGTFAYTTLSNIVAINNVNGIQVGVSYGQGCGRPPTMHQVVFCNIKVPNGQMPMTDSE